MLSHRVGGGTSAAAPDPHHTLPAVGPGSEVAWQLPGGSGQQQVQSSRDLQRALFFFCDKDSAVPGGHREHSL